MTGRDYDPLKRAIDVVAALVGLVLTAPIQAVVAILVRRNLGSPVFFRQLRPGKDEKLFELIKFRTMATVNPQEGLITDEQRMTRFGAALRSTSLDELPTLWNVLRGDMSLVGPRPLLVAYLDRYTIDQRRRHDVRPGITGLAQANGRNAIAWEEKFAQDIQYIETRSLLLDLKILWRTVAGVLKREGIRAEGVATMPEFTGRWPSA